MEIILCCGKKTRLAIVSQVRMERIPAYKWCLGEEEHLFYMSITGRGSHFYVDVFPSTFGFGERDGIVNWTTTELILDTVTPYGILTITSKAEGATPVFILLLCVLMNGYIYWQGYNLQMVGAVVLCSFSNAVVWIGKAVSSCDKVEYPIVERRTQVGRLLGCLVYWNSSIPSGPQGAVSSFCDHPMWEPKRLRTIGRGATFMPAYSAPSHLPLNRNHLYLTGSGETIGGKKEVLSDKK